VPASGRTPAESLKSMITAERAVYNAASRHTRGVACPGPCSQQAMVRATSAAGMYRNADRRGQCTDVQDHGMMYNDVGQPRVPPGVTRVVLTLRV
jgi:hypothetical protein